MDFPAYITVISSTGQPVPGASINFLSLNARTDSSGLATLWYSNNNNGQNATLTASAPGFSDASQSVAVPLLGGAINLVVTLAPALTSTSINVLVRDKDSQAPLSGANVFAGFQPAVVTTVTGQAQVWISGTTQITVSAPGYLTATQNVVNQGSPVFDLQLDQAAAKSVKVTVAPADQIPAQTSGANVQVQDGLLAENYQVGPDGSFTTAPTHKSGAILNLTITHPNYQQLVTTVTLTSQSAYTVGPMTALSGNADAGQAATTATGAGKDIVKTPIADTLSNVIPLDQIKPPDSYEYIYPSGDYGKYFTTTQARMYIGNIFVDELNTVQFALQANRIPIYGYASRDWDAVALGKALVQGQLVINFISEGYLYTIVKEHAKLQQELRDADNPNIQNQQQFDNLRRQKILLTSGQFTYPGDRQSQGSNPNGSPQAVGSVADVRVQLIEQKMGQLAALGPAVIDRGRFSQPGPMVYANACYLPFPFDIEIELEGAGRVVKRRLEQCYLGANEQIMDQSGNPLAETYSFIARRLR